MSVHYSSRAFLNRPDNYASESTVVCKVVLTLAKDTESTSYINGEIAIRDCNNRIRLDIDASAPENMGEQDMGYLNSLHKIDTLISELTHLREAFVSATVLARKTDETNQSAKQNAENKSSL